MLMGRLQEKEHEFRPYMLAIWLGTYDDPSDIEPLAEKMKQCDLYTSMVLYAFFFVLRQRITDEFQPLFPSEYTGKELLAGADKLDRRWSHFYNLRALSKAREILEGLFGKRSGKKGKPFTVDMYTIHEALTVLAMNRDFGGYEINVMRQK